MAVFVSIVLLSLLATPAACQFTCADDELYHSSLVEFSSSATIGAGAKEEDLAGLFPQSSKQIEHIYSTLSGQRLVRKTFSNLNADETEYERLLNINTTFYVSTKSQERIQAPILGFGATLNTKRLFKLLANQNDPNQFERTNSLLFQDLFSKTRPSNRLTFLRLPISVEDTRQHNVSHLLLELDSLLASLGNYDTQTKPLRLILELQQFKRGADLIDAIRQIVTSGGAAERNKPLLLSSVEFWALAFERPLELSDLQFGQEHIAHIRQLLPQTTLLFGSTKLSQAAQLISRNSDSFDGLLIKSEPSVPYDLLRLLRETYPKLHLLPIGRTRVQTKYHGDWQNAQEYTVEILNHLRYGANGFLDELTSIELFDEAANGPGRLDAPIYSLQQSHGIHFRGPMYYSMGHFSRFLEPESKLLASSIFTQQNMFSSHYEAFLTPSNYVVVEVSNSNEHLLWFRVALDGKIVVKVDMEPKSFNTIIIKV